MDFTWLVSTLESWGLWGIFFMYAAEAMALPWPIEVPLWLSGAMLHAGVTGYWQVVLATWSGTSAGNLLAFLIARLGGRPLLITLSRRLHLQGQVNRMQGWIERYGIGAVVVTRWINWGFGISLWLAGFSRIPPGRAVAAMILNNALWACMWVLLGRELVGVLRHVGLPDWLVLVPGAVLLVVWVTWQILHRYRVEEG